MVDDQSPNKPLTTTTSSNNGKLHPALAISNSHPYVSVTFEMENVLYSTWAEFFQIHCLSIKVINHILPDTKPDPSDNYNED
ncbi:hypothetical protein LIER_13425 [Lithospermum erythrorhizon]|uniref:Uncharacterized protein n=1 Tax=Lithospermum erythrorhizon TaxID=34254 RepID=A0AAV3PXD5_LITER